MRRHEFEADTLSAKQTYRNSGLQVPAVDVSFPFSCAFSKVQEVLEEISNATKRPVGRPAGLKKTPMAQVEP